MKKTASKNKSFWGPLLLRCSAISINFIIFVITTHALGTKQYGQYSQAVSWLWILWVSSRMGMEKVIVREVASLREQLKWNELRGLIRFSGQQLLTASVCLLLVGLAISLTLNPGTDLTMRWLILGLPAMTLMVWLRAQLEGFSRVVIAQVPETLVMPICLLCAVSVLSISGHINAINVAQSHAIALVIGVAAAWILGQQICKSIPSTGARQYRRAIWLKSGFMLLLVNALWSINRSIDILMLGYVRGDEAAGIYGAASRISDVTMLAYYSVGLVIGPTLARLYKSGHLNQMQRELTHGAKWAFCAGLAITSILLAMKPWFGTLFGSGFEASYFPLAILMTGQLTIMLSGFAPLTCTMVGFERIIVIIASITTALNIVLNYIFIHHWGPIGAALATSITFALFHGWLASLLFKRTKLNTFAWRFTL